MLVAANPLIQVIPGLMIWTIVSFAITLWVLKRYAFGPVQKLIDDRRDRIRQSIEEADRAREEARRLLEEHRALIGQAKGQAEEILAEARKVADAQRERLRGELEEDRQGRLDETQRQIEQATAQALGEIRREVASLSKFCRSRYAMRYAPSTHYAPFPPEPPHPIPLPCGEREEIAARSDHLLALDLEKSGDLAHALRSEYRARAADALPLSPPGRGRLAQRAG